ncbi:MAG: MauE/DoxX family redox-associated membrane protein, partial [Luteolibacter sp.]
FKVSLGIRVLRMQHKKSLVFKCRINNIRTSRRTMTKKKSSHGDWIASGMRYLIGAVMLWASISKIGSPVDFLGSIYAYDLPLPDVILKCAAIVLPWLELICGLLLLFNHRVTPALSLVIGMIFVFVLATVQAWIRGLDISCGCFNLGIVGLEEDSAISKMLESPGVAFGRNLFLLCASCFLFHKTVSRNTT